MSVFEKTLNHHRDGAVIDDILCIENVLAHEEFGLLDEFVQDLPVKPDGEFYQRYPTFAPLHDDSLYEGPDDIGEWMMSNEVGGWLVRAETPAPDGFGRRVEWFWHAADLQACMAQAHDWARKLRREAEQMTKEAA